MRIFVVFVVCVLVFVTGAELDSNCIPQDITHMGVARNCCKITCGPGEEPRLCMKNSPYTSSCQRCSVGTYNPGKIAIGEGQCLSRKVCDDKDHMFYNFLGNETHDAVCDCEEGFTLEGKDPEICVLNVEKSRNFTEETLRPKVICKLPASATGKFRLQWSSFFVGGCAVFITCLIGVGLWCFFVYCDHCRRDRKSDFKPVSWSNLKSKKQRILASCFRDKHFQNQCWLIILEAAGEKVGPYWKELAYKLCRGTDVNVSAIERDYRGDMKGKTRSLLNRWKIERGCEPSDINEEIIGHMLRALKESGHTDIHDQAIDEIWERFGEDLKNQNTTKGQRTASQEQPEDLEVNKNEQFYYTEEC